MALKGVQTLARVGTPSPGLRHGGLDDKQSGGWKHATTTGRVREEPFSSGSCHRGGKGQILYPHFYEFRHPMVSLQALIMLDCVVLCTTCERASGGCGFSLRQRRGKAAGPLLHPTILLGGPGCL